MAQLCLPATGRHGCAREQCDLPIGKIDHLNQGKGFTGPGPGILLEVQVAMVVYVANSLGSNHLLIIISIEWSARNKQKG